MLKLLHAQWVTPAIVILVAGAAVATVSPNFLSNYNVYAILEAASTIAVVGLAQMVVLGVGDMNLSVGGIGSVATVIVGGLPQNFQVSVVAAAVLAIFSGAFAGLLNGLIITQTKLVSFIVTLGTGGALTGAALGITQSRPYPDISPLLVSLGQDRIGFLPYVGIVPIALAVTVAAFFRWIPAGRAILAVGGNKEAADLSGISSNRSRVLAQVMSGAIAALGAVAYVGVLGTASPAIGSDWTLTSFAVPIIGGTALSGGYVSVVGCLTGALLLATISNALISLSVSQYAVMFTQGSLIFLAVVAGRLRLSNNTSGTRNHDSAVRSRGGGVKDAISGDATGAA